MTRTDTRPTVDERPLTGGDVVTVVRADSDARGSVGVVDPDTRVSLRDRRSEQWVRVSFAWPGSSTERLFRFRGRDLALAGGE